MPRAVQAPDATRVAQRANQASVQLQKHFLTSKQKPSPNQRHQFTDRGMDTKGFAEFAKSINSDTALALCKPAIGISVHACTLSRADIELSPYVNKGILGKGIVAFIREMEKITDTLKTLDSSSDSAGRGFTTMQRDVDKLAEYMKKLHSSSTWKDLVVNLRSAGVRLMHYAQALQELMFVFGGDSLDTAKAIPPNQPLPDLLAAAAKSSSAQTARPRPTSY